MRRALRAQARHAICGGVAVTIHGATRSTKDIDILIAPADADKAVEAVRAIGYRFAALPLVFDEGTARERHVQRVSKLEEVGGGRALPRRRGPAPRRAACLMRPRESRPAAVKMVRARSPQGTGGLPAHTSSLASGTFEHL